MAPTKKSTSQTVEVLHPRTKRSVSIDKKKYALVRSSVVKVLRMNAPCTHTELFKGVTADVKARGTKFTGSLEWYMEWVKLDLETRGVVRRETVKSRQRFSLSAK